MSKRVMLGWLMIGCALIVSVAILIKYPDMKPMQIFELYWVSYLSWAVFLAAGCCLVLAGRRR